jgi:hypothetical protein
MERAGPRGMAHKRKDYRKTNPTDTNTGPGHGVSSMGGVPVGGGTMSGENDGVPQTILGGRDTDTGMLFGPGQGTSTGSLPTAGGPDLSGTGIAERSGVLSGQGYDPPYGHSSASIDDPSSEREKSERYDFHDTMEGEENKPED